MGLGVNRSRLIKSFFYMLKNALIYKEETKIENALSIQCLNSRASILF